METLFLFSSYDRRVAELMDLYKRYFEAMNLLNESGEKIFVIHGAIAAAKCSDERYVERVAALIDAGREAGVVVAQENVSYCKSGSLDFLQMLRRELGERAVFVLDLKQARRSGICPLHMIDTLGDSIVHLHLSDAVAGDSERDCLSVGAGDFDFATMFAKLKAVGYSGGGVVELYRENYDESAELAKSVEILEKLLQTT
jgi:sugar phosphate isomerase/epimerase